MTAPVLRAHVEPRYLTGHPPITPGGADRLAPVASMLGLDMRGWWCQIADVALDRRVDRWRYPVVVLSVPRQAGKTSLVSVVAVERCMAHPDTAVHYTAQSRADAVARFGDLVKLLRRSPLRQWVGARPPKASDEEWDWRASIGKGTEVVGFSNGSTVEVFAPRPDSLHGSTTSLVVLDEARFYSAALGSELLAAALPTQSTRDGQVWIVSTAGDPDSTFLAEWLDAGRRSLADPDTRICFGDWGITDDVGSGEVLGAAWSAHPAAGLPGGPTRAAFELAVETMPAHEFSREYGNVWLSEDVNRLLPASWWSATTSASGPPAGVPFCLAFDVAPDRSGAAIVACGGDVVEVTHADRGARWLGPTVMERVRRWGDQLASVIADPSGPASSVVEELRPLLGEKLVVVKARELVAACGAFYDALGASALAHVPHAALDDAVARATQRAVSGAWVFSRDDGGHVLVAATLAYWAHSRPVTTDEPPAVF